MKRLKRFVASIAIASLIVSTPPSRADMFGGDGVPRMARV